MYSIKESMEFEKVLNYHIDCIFKSGLLLDEHDELLQEFLRLPNYGKPKLGIFPLASIVCGLCLSLHTKSSLPLGLSTVPLGVTIFNGFMIKWRCRIYNRNMSGLIECFQKNFQLNKCIIQYYHKKKVSLTKVDQSTRTLIETPVISKLSEFLLYVTKKMWEIVLYIKDKLIAIRETFNIKEFSSVYDLNIPEDTIASNTDEELISSLETVQMCFVFAASTLLCGIGLSFLHVDFQNKKHLTLFSTIIPECYIFVQDVCQKLSNEYKNISYRLPMSTSDHSKQTHVNNIPLQSALNSLSENLRLSFDTVTALQISAGPELDLSQLRHQIDDLDKLLAECVNTLTFLRFEYTKPPNYDPPGQQNSVRIPSAKEEEQLQVIRYDDIQSAARNEEYSLSIHGSDSDLSSDDEESKLDYEQLRKQLRNQKMIIRELNDELKKRQLIKQTDVDVAQKDQISSSSSGYVSETQVIQRLDIPLPPPPPQDFSVDMSELSTENSVCLPSKDFLAQICAVAQSRGVEEDVFGEDTFSSEEESDA